MNNEITLFENPDFGEIRTIVENGEPWFVAKDVAEILGYSETAMMTRRLDEDEKTNLPFRQSGSNYQTNLTVINESGLYNAVLGSKKPEAKAFKKWVTSEVLPSIRKHGGYLTVHDDETEDELLAKAFVLAQKTLERRERRIKALECEVIGREKVIEEMIPKVDYVDQILMSPDTVTITQIAKDYDLTPQQLNKILHEERVQYKVYDQWVLYANHTGKGYTRSETINVSKKAGKDKFIMTTKWTQKGRLLIHELLKQRNILPYMEV